MKLSCGYSFFICFFHLKRKSWCTACTIFFLQDCSPVQQCKSYFCSLADFDEKPKTSFFPPHSIFPSRYTPDGTLAGAKVGKWKQVAGVELPQTERGAAAIKVTADLAKKICT